MMDWYNGLDTEDFVVPKDEELLDVFPSEDSWQQWGMSGSQNFGWPMKYEPMKKADLPDDKAVFGKATAQESLHESESPNGFSMTGGWPSDQWCEDTMEQDRPNFQFNDMMQNDQMDDIFLSSLLKEDPTASENNDVKSSQLCSETQLSSGSVDGDSESLMFDFQSVCGAIQSRESSRDFETGHVGTSNVNNSTSMGLNDRRLGKACPSKVLHPSYKKRSNGRNGGSGSGCTREEVSLEEAVLNDLGETLTQLSTNTRLCFRDSFYRLAQNSTKQTLLSGQAKDPSPYELSEMEFEDEQMRSGESSKAESETNTIDRAVANFVFKKVDVNTQDLHPAMSPTKRRCEAVDENKATKYISFSQPEIFAYPPT